MNLVINSRFRPFTYDEMVKPLVQYKEAYDKVEQDYSNLVAQTEAWKDIATQENSPEAYAMYKEYSDRLNAVVDDFSKGMNMSNRRALIGMKRDYAKNIVPIATAAKRRDVLADEQRKAELQNPTMMWQRKASDMSLDDFIHNPSADYGNSYSGAALSAQVAAGAGALAKEFRENPEKMRKLVGGDYYEYAKQRGFSSEAVLATIMNSPNASPVLTQLIESSIDSTGIREWGDNATLEQAYNYARQGLWNAVGQDETQLVQNWRAHENLSHRNAMARQESAQKFQIEQMTPREILNSDGTSTGTYYDPKIGLVVNNKGNVQLDEDGNMQTKPSRSQTPTLTPKQKVEQKKSEALNKVSSIEDIRKLGYTPVFATLKLSGKWYSKNEGEDAPSTYGGYTRSNVVQDNPGPDWFFADFGTSGDVSFEKKDLRRSAKKDGGITYVDPGEGNTYPSIPADAKKSLSEQLSTMDLMGKDIQILRVKSERGNGVSGDDYDYVICVKNN